MDADARDPGQAGATRGSQRDSAVDNFSQNGDQCGKPFPQGVWITGSSHLDCPQHFHRSECECGKLARAASAKYVADVCGEVDGFRCSIPPSFERSV
jgi:hypothetical protein